MVKRIINYQLFMLSAEIIAVGSELLTPTCSKAKRKKR
jgi:hypothetical protein